MTERGRKGTEGACLIMCKSDGLFGVLHSILMTCCEINFLTFTLPRQRRASAPSLPLPSGSTLISVSRPGLRWPGLVSSQWTQQLINIPAARALRRSPRQKWQNEATKLPSCCTRRRGTDTAKEREKEREREGRGRKAESDSID